MHSPLRSILVGVGPAGADSLTLSAAAALAQRERARLTVLAAEVRPSSMTLAAPIALPHDPVRAARDECGARLRAAVDALPEDLSVTALLCRDAPASALLAELGTGRHDLVVVGAGRRRRRVARALLRRSHVPVLVVSDNGA